MRLSHLALLALALSLAGCDSCPYQVRYLGAGGQSTARFDLQNATLALQTFDDMGFDTGQSDGLLVRGEKGDLAVYLDLNDGGTSFRLTKDFGPHEFRTGSSADEFVRAHQPEAEAAYNATMQEFQARLHWPEFVPVASDWGPSIC